MKATAYQVQFCLNFENKSYEVHNPKPNYLTSEQEPINKTTKPPCQFYGMLLHSVTLFVANIAEGLERAYVITSLDFVCVCACILLDSLSDSI